MTNNFVQKDLHIVQLLSNQVDKVTSICNSLIREHNAIVDDYNKLLSEHNDLKAKLKEFIDSVKQESIKVKQEVVTQPDLFITLDETKLADYLVKPLTKVYPHGKPSMRLLYDTQAKEIKRLIKEGYKNKDIAKTFNIKQSIVNAIRNNKTYKDININ